MLAPTTSRNRPHLSCVAVFAPEEAGKYKTASAFCVIPDSQQQDDTHKYHLPVGIDAQQVEAVDDKIQDQDTQHGSQDIPLSAIDAGASHQYRRHHIKRRIRSRVRRGGDQSG